ncbi:MAG: DNRLRE domain-containing protein [Candidatus Eiseniibacteriota bacterium]
MMALACRGAAIVAALIASTALPAFADPVQVPIVETAVISDRAGNTRILVKPGDLSAFDDRLITWAELHFTLPGLLAARDVPVRVYPLTQDWSAGAATWDSPWVKPGGDFEDAYYDTAVLAAGSRETSLSLEVTSIVRAIVEGEYGRYGFLITVPGYDGAGFRPADLATLGTLTGATLEVDSRTSVVAARAAQARRAQAGRGEGVME